jgi:hypothetical protein
MYYNMHADKPTHMNIRYYHVTTCEGPVLAGRVLKMKKSLSIKTSPPIEKIYIIFFMRHMNIKTKI